MSVELLQTLSLVAFIMGGVMFLVAIALFFLFNVPRLYGEVSGATARKAIESIRQQNEVSGNKAYRPSPVNASRGKLTDKITPSGRIEVKDSSMFVSVGTSKLLDVEDTGASSETVLLEADTGSTTLLTDVSAAPGFQQYENAAVSGNTGIEQDIHTEFAPSFSDAGDSDSISIEVDINFVGSAEIIE